MESLTTPSFLVDLDVLEKNIQGMSDLCKTTGNYLCPMVKTHKCSEIALLQQEAGVSGFLVGTIDEAEVLVEKGIKNIVFPYPIANEKNIKRVIKLCDNAHITISFDGEDAVELWSRLLQDETKSIDVLIIIDSGLHRFGIAPREAGNFALKLNQYSWINIKGISTHPGHVYGVSSSDGVEQVALEEHEALEVAKKSISDHGISVEVVATGSTPTIFKLAPQVKGYTFRPGNYVFNDAIQLSLDVVQEDSCAFSVLATIISHPNENTFLIDAGSKCFGLDKGAHGNALVVGYGKVKGHPELLVAGLSEEVGKIEIQGNTTLSVGDRIEVIPNHSCASANMTSYLVGHRGGVVQKILEVDARGGSMISK